MVFEHKLSQVINFVQNMPNIIILDHMRFSHPDDTHARMLLQHEKQQESTMTRWTNEKLILNECNPDSIKVEILIQNLALFKIVHMGKLM